MFCSCQLSPSSPCFAVFPLSRSPPCFAAFDLSPSPPCFAVVTSHPQRHACSILDLSPSPPCLQRFGPLTLTAVFAASICGYHCVRCANAVLGRLFACVRDRETERQRERERERENVCVCVCVIYYPALYCLHLDSCGHLHVHADSVFTIKSVEWGDGDEVHKSE